MSYPRTPIFYISSESIDQDVEEESLEEFEPYQLQEELKTLVLYIQFLNEEPVFVPTLYNLMELCKNLVYSLGYTAPDVPDLLETVSAAEEFLLRTVTTEDSVRRGEVIATVLKTIYAMTSDPKHKVNVVASAALVVCNAMSNEQILEAVRNMLQEEDEANADRKHHDALNYFMRWTYEWRPTAALGDWLLAFIKILEEKKQFKILIKVGLKHLSSMFKSLLDLNPVQSINDVILYVMASLRNRRKAFMEIALYVCEVLDELAADRRPWCQKLLQNVVDLTKYMVECGQKAIVETDFIPFTEYYADIIACLEQRVAMPSNYYLHMPPWSDGIVPIFQSPKKVTGLKNLGTTCYMNSVLQALLANNLFSSHVVKNRCDRPYWLPLGELFVKMLHDPVSSVIDPIKVYKATKPPSFRHNEEQDCFEYLLYLLNLLIAHENLTMVKSFATNDNYSENACSPLPSENSSEPMDCSDSSIGSETPLPYSDATAIARPGRIIYSSDPLNREQCIVDENNFVDQIFGGKMLIRVTCSDCQEAFETSYSIRDLQLTFSDDDLGEHHSIQSLINLHCSSTLMTDGDMFRCFECNGLRPAVRVELFETTPQYLIVGLNNFKYDPILKIQRKLVRQIFYNMTVTLPVWYQEIENTYTLYACIIHTGVAIETGHYYTLAKNYDAWCTFDDDEVTVVSDDYLQALGRLSTPRVLFYRRTDVKETHRLTYNELPVKFLQMLNVS
ncbi:ubiquitin carboxyl-terminal hydrolase 38-like [Battus philenor]|uniref:ubiquitin carboxyl-terminal hydrolase 38-like n=1 Tax=Battus philenor TaxID=42288 RepID=UPI0035CF7138